MNPFVVSRRRLSKDREERQVGNPHNRKVMISPMINQIAPIDYRSIRREMGRGRGEEAIKKKRKKRNRIKWWRGRRQRRVVRQQQHPPERKKRWSRRLYSATASDQAPSFIYLEYDGTFLHARRSEHVRKRQFFFFFFCFFLLSGYCFTSARSWRLIYNTAQLFLQVIFPTLPCLQKSSNEARQEEVPGKAKCFHRNASCGREIIWSSRPPYKFVEWRLFTGPFISSLLQHSWSLFIQLRGCRCWPFI